ncbi:MAG: transporter associated domain-containing protein [Candidatus Accumulibacter phosphatis]|uniref:Magnesium and cobalt efflux protein CorC n=2 Tax=Candidatus Accumulibacter TaxID=327159 RepID=A0A080LVY3_9PROT|nr:MULTISPECIES: transporter associated domain-containing protein [Candidatus Accumulibacter]KFB71880.1 MAG: Magnesium and cobalt efflux protein CorC [Candidatus Accumulibacter phosphatis]MBL8407997.1 CBS domain-containing protein [Accumulibacter sp.]NMQ05159.1 CBS domain-containing protein [Candidatus Accumulibacter contiguus]
MDPSSPRSGFLERLSSFLVREPEDREQLMQLLHSAHQRKLLDADALSITEGAIAASEMSVREVMVPRPLMEVVDVSDSLAEVISQVNTTAHSRFPVINGSRDNVIGILLAKDLLRVQREDDFKLRDWVRPAVFIPEFKRLDVLLREFRVSRNHMAIVIDEYAGIAGLITIEDVLEQIVGEIEDEYDFDESDDNIQLDPNGLYRVKAHTAIADFDAAFGTRFSEEKCQTVGGLILHHLGRVPQFNETIVIDGICFQVLRADSRRIYTLVVSNLPEAGDPAE